MQETFKAIVIGSGFGGQTAAISLQKMGIDDFVILERRQFMGGTWCQNTYPGAAVDVQSPLYSLSFEPYDWSQMFAGQAELQSYTEHIIDKYQLRQRTRTNTEVTEIRWLESKQCWRIECSGGRVYEARYIINATGPLSTPVIPDFPGRDSFGGESFHTNAWNHDFDYRGKKVAIIGSGASAAQVIPEIAPEVEQLHVFQRTPHWVLPRPDYVFKPWQRRLLRKKWLYKLLRRAIYWGLEYRLVAFKYSQWLLDKIGRKQALKHIQQQIADPELRRAVTPDYTIGCKRILVSSTLYPAYCRDNVCLHTREDGIAAINERGIETSHGEQVDLDLIVYSTGYDATDGVISYPVIGRDGSSLQDFWDPFPRAYLGTSIPKFPNLFIVTGPNTGIGHTSALFIIEAQMRYIRDCIEAVESQAGNSIEVQSNAEERYTAHIHEEMQRTVWKSGGCHSWYQSKSGHVIAMFPGFSFTYRRWAGNFQTDHHQFT